MIIKVFFLILQMLKSVLSKEVEPAAKEEIVFVEYFSVFLAMFLLSLGTFLVVSSI
jgi:hypothetical protein